MRLRVVALLFAVIALASACRVDTVVDIRLDTDGTGELAVTATVDAAVVAAAPGLLDDVAVDDLITAGWTVEGPTPTPAGGATITVRRMVSSPADATAWLATVNGAGGPLSEVVLDRVPGERTVEFSLTGRGGIVGGLAAFADDSLIALTGTTPYADALESAGTTVSDAIGVTVRAELPGDLVTTTGSVDDDGRIVWEVPTDGAAIDLLATSTESLERGIVWRFVTGVALVALVGWVVLSVVLVALVLRARRYRP